jgi:aminopeptidase N
MMCYRSTSLFLLLLLLLYHDYGSSFTSLKFSSRQDRQLSPVTKSSSDSTTMFNLWDRTWILHYRSSCLQLHPMGGGFGGASSTSKKGGKRKTKNNTTAGKRPKNAASPTPANANAVKSIIAYRKDYREPAHWVTHVSLDFNIVHDDKVRVTSTMTVQPNPNRPSSLDDFDFFLNGDTKIVDLKRLSLMENDGSGETRTDLEEGTDYELSSDILRIKEHILDYKKGDDEIILQTVVELSSFENNNGGGELSGLYRRDGMFATHCEPTGFRQITYFPDRPDNTAVFQVRIEAPKETYPLLLSNGNCIESGDLDISEGTEEESGDRHYAVFKDPHPKPSYIFGLVAAGNLARLCDTYTTASGKEVKLRIYSEAQSISRLTFALETLKKSMAWDEETYGLEYDLDVYNIVAAQHFFLGAMENKGLNIFQTSLIATDPQSTTDVTYDLVEKTVAHEYFHNWSGNRVTVRDWFEFSLKEGLTVYRDQEFTADVGLRTITRIEAVKILREKQFREDASESRHAIRPESASASREHTLDALASSTTYHKGAEVGP